MSATTPTPDSPIPDSPIPGSPIPGSPTPGSPPGPPTRTIVAVALTAGAAGGLIGGWIGALIGAFTGGLAVLTPFFAGCYTVLALGTTAVLTATQRRFSPRSMTTTMFDRPLAPELGRWAGIMLVGLLLARSVAERSPAGPARPSATGDRSPGDRPPGGSRPPGGFQTRVVAPALRLLPEPLRRRADRLLPTATEARTSGHLMTGSSWVMAGFIAQAITGVLFWVVALRRFDQTDVGLATGLFSTLQFLNYATSLGLQETLGRFPADTAHDRLLGWSVLATAASSVAGVLLLVGFTHSEALDLLTTGSPAGRIAMFTLLSVANAVALLVDVRLMGARRWTWVAGRLAFTGAARIPLALLPPIGNRAVWLFVIMTAPIALSGLAGLALHTRLTGRPTRINREVAWRGEAVRFAGVNYLAQLALQAPQFLLPVIVVANVRPRAYANFFLAWTIAAVAFILPVVIGRVLLSEQSRTDGQASTRHAAVLAVSVMVAAVIGATALAAVLPLAYGNDYRDAARLLPWIVAGGVPWSLTSVALTHARIRKDHLATVVMTVVLATAIIGLALILVPREGSQGALTAWSVGNMIAAVVAVALIRRTGGAQRDFEPHDA